MRFSQSTHLLMCLSLETLTSTMVNFPAWIPDCDSHSPALLDLFISSDTTICSTMAFPALGNYEHIVVSVFIDFPTNSKQDTLFCHIVYDYSCAD